jgi:hypothetical protein
LTYFYKLRFSESAVMLTFALFTDMLSATVLSAIML